MYRELDALYFTNVAKSLYGSLQFSSALLSWSQHGEGSGSVFGVQTVDPNPEASHNAVWASVSPEYENFPISSFTFLVI